MACQTSNDSETVAFAGTRSARTYGGRAGVGQQNGAGKKDLADNDPFGVPVFDVAKATIEVRLGFVRQVYGILCVQLLLTTLVAAPFQLVETQWLLDNIWLVWLSMVVTISTICIISCFPDLARQHPINEIMLITITVFEGVLIGFVSASYTWQSVILASGITVVIFLGLTAYAFMTTRDFTGFGPYLFGVLLTLCIFGFALSTMSLFGVQVDGLAVVYDVVGVIVFVIYIIYDTQLMLGEWGGHQNSYSIEDHVFAALSLYLDIVNLFMHVLRLMGQSDKT